MAVHKYGGSAKVSDKIGDVMKWMVALWITTILVVIATGMFG